MTTVKEWTQDNVGKWLCSVNLGYLAVKFETLRIDGAILMSMDEGYIDMHLRLNPAERTAFTGALYQLRSQQQYATLPPPAPARMSSAGLPRTNYTGAEHNARPRFDSEAAKRVVKIQHQSPSLTPEVKLAPAMELLKNCRHSGWIRKQGGSHKGWRQRYMVLRLGHLYYYDKETSLKPKGYFSVQGYSVEPCTEVFKGKPWCFKLIPAKQNERTYVVSTAAEHEMKKWMVELQDELYSYEDHVYDPVAIEEEDVDDEEDEGNYEKMDGPSEIYDDVEEAGYVKISKGPVAPSTSQTFPRTNNIDSPSSPKRNTLQPLCKTPSSSPYVPPRSRESLGSPNVTTLARDSNTVVPTSAPVQPLLQEEENPYYLKLIDTGDPSPTTHAGSVPNEPHFNNPPPPRRSTDSMIHHPTLSPVRDNRSSSYGGEEEIEEENPYYIKLDDLDDVLPQHCQFGIINREEAVRRLTQDSRGNQKHTRPGTYLIRNSAHKDVLHVLSVWTGSECKHYKLFCKDSAEEGKGYCLTQGKLFPSIPLLISFYKQEELPRSPNVTLSDPYHPLDH